MSDRTSADTPGLPGVPDLPDLSQLPPGAGAHAARHVHTGAFPARIHDHFEAAFVLHGSGLLRTPDRDIHLYRGLAILLPPGVEHSAAECRSLTAYHLLFRTSLLRHELSWALTDPVLSRLFRHGPATHTADALTVRVDEPELQDALTHLESLAHLRSRPATARRADLVGRVSLLLAVLARALSGTATRPADALTHPAVADALRILDSRTSHDWTLTELADALSLTPSYLSRLFKEHTGVPPMTYLARRRAEKAADLLAHTDSTIADIAEYVGWSDQNYFARRFKAHFGLTPSEYRHGAGIPLQRGSRAEAPHLK